MSNDENEQINYGDYGLLQDSWARPLTKERRLELQRIGHEIAISHGIANIEAHESLVFRLRSIVTTYSPIEVVEEGLPLASDLPKFAEAKRKIERASRALKDFDDAIHEVTRDPTMRAILDIADPDGVFSEDFSTFSGLRMEAVLQAATNMQGPRGRPPNPRWITEFLSLCREFWSLHRSGGSRPSPHLERKDELDSPVTEWAHSLFVNLCDFEGLEHEEAKFQTEAKRLPKK